MFIRVHIPAGAGTAAQLFSTVLVVLGLTCASSYIWMCTDQFVYQSAQQQYLPSALPSKGVEHSDVGSPAPETLSQPTERTRGWVSWIAPDPAVIGRLEIPRLNVNVIIREGTDT